MAINFNTDPYWDDFETPTAVDGLSPREKYNRILFRPGIPLQARELTQLQTTLQHQISSIGDHAFKNGAMVIPGGVTVHNQIGYIKLIDGYSGNITDWVGLAINDGGTTEARVVHGIDATATDPATLYIRYIAGDINTATTVGGFTNGSAVSGTDDNNVTYAATIGNLINSGDQQTVGEGSLVSVDDGIYYINKNFVVVKAATVVVAKYDTNVTSDIGFFVTESVIGPGEDESLNDNATGSPNETAPGAHRLQIKTELGIQTDPAASNFVMLVKLEEGRILSQVLRTDYAFIEETLARRTFDESGNYSVNPVRASVKDGDTSFSVNLAVEPCKAYVKGYEIDILSKTDISINRARTTELATYQSVNTNDGSYVDIMSSLSGGTQLPSYGDTIELKDNAGTLLGSALVYSVRQTVIGNNAATDVYRININNVNTVVVGLYGLTTAEANGAGWTIDDYIIGNDSYILQLPYNKILTHDTDISGTIPAFDYRYEITRTFGTKIVNGTEVVFNSASNETFTDYEGNDWVAYCTLDGQTPAATINQAFRRGDFDVVLSNNNQTATLTINSHSWLGQLTGSVVELVAPVIKTTSHKTKTLEDGTNGLGIEDSIPSYPNSVITDFTVWQDLTNSDIVEIIKIEEWDVNNSLALKDITEHFEIDNGQRSTHYGLGRVRVKPGSHYAVPYATNTEIKITYTHYSHSITGDFFTVDSYVDGGIAYDDIKTFEDIDLRDVVDFRSVNGVLANPMRANTTFETNLQYYLGRIDKVAMTRAGEFTVVEGTPALVPPVPDDPTNGMTIFWLLIPPYTKNAKDVQIKHIDNKRYTMRDIGAIEKRINQLEYYTSLNSLENAAKEQQIYSGGIDRFKSGFLVDPFINGAVSNVFSKDFNCAIDASNGECRPTFEEENIDLERIQPPAPLISDNTVQTEGGLITLAYSETPVITQLQASDTINVNPYDVFNWTGSLKLDPSTDEWKEVERLPDVMINDESKYDSLLADMQRTTAVGTVWNEWETNWTGTPITTVTDNVRWSSGGNGGTHTLTTVTNTGISTRSGITTSIVPSSVIERQDDRVVDVTFIPYMRSRLVNCKLTRCRPSTQLYAFFDGIDISDYVSQNASPSNMDIATSALLSQTSHPSGATTLTTSIAGELDFTFWVPNNDALNFTSGVKDLVLTDSILNDSSLTTTSAVAEYAAKGLLEKKENVTISTRVPKIVRTDASQTVDTNSSSSAFSNRRQTTWADPLAQSIKIDIAGGVFATSIDLYFATVAATAEVTISIREMQNGMPTQIELPFSEVSIAPSSINTTGPTAFTFDSPVYLEESVEYCFVIMSNSNEYNIHYGTVGERDSTTDEMIQGQAYAGVMFKSQNASTWTAMQESDIKFELNIADFVNAGEIYLAPKVVPPSKLVNDPFKATSGSSVLNVKHSNHGLQSGDTVVYTNSGDVSTAISANVINIPTGHTISNPTEFGYDIDVAVNAGETNIFGGTVIAQSNVVYNVLNPIMESIVLNNTSMDWFIRSTTHNGSQYGMTDSGIYGYNVPANLYSPLTGTTTARIDINSNYTTPEPQYALSVENGILAGIDGNGLMLAGYFTSDSSVSVNGVHINNLSPVIDMHRCSLIAIANNINNDSTDEGLPEVGLAMAKYVTKYVTLNEDSDELKVWLDISRPTGSDIKVYVQAGHQDITNNAWIEADAVNIPYTGNEFSEVMFETTGITGSFSTFAVKVVMLSDNTSNVPRIRNFRAIAII
jgi:hypothetical protein